MAEKKKQRGRGIRGRRHFVDREDPKDATVANFGGGKLRRSSIKQSHKSRARTMSETELDAAMQRVVDKFRPKFVGTERKS